MSNPKHNDPNIQPIKVSVFHQNLERAVQMVKPKKTDMLLDIGKYGGETALYFAQYIHSLTVIDDRYSTMELEDKFKSHNVENIKEIKGNFNLEGELPFADNCFDIVTARAILTAIHKPDNFMKEIFRVLRPQGKIDIWIPIFSDSSKVLWTSLSKVIHKSYGIDFSYFDIINLLDENNFNVTNMCPFKVPRSLNEKLSVIQDEDFRDRILNLFLENRNVLKELNFRWIDEKELLKKLGAKNLSGQWFHDFNTIEIVAIKK